MPAGPVPSSLPAPVNVADDEAGRLLSLARAAVRLAVEGGAAISNTPPLGSTGGSRRATATGRMASAFVTLTSGGTLRGCVGRLAPDGPVEAAVVEAATWAALDDPRFPSIRPGELAGLHLEVSVLGPMVALEDPLAFRVGVDGILVERAGHRGILLPEVAAALDDDPVAMLDTACRKAGLDAGAWRRHGTRVFAFRTARFGGPALAPDTAASAVPDQAAAAR